MSENLILSAYFGISDKKRVFKIKEEFERDMQLNFVRGQITRVTDAFENWTLDDMVGPKQNDFMVQMMKEPGARD